MSSRWKVLVVGDLPGWAEELPSETLSPAFVLEPVALEEAPAVLDARGDAIAAVLLVVPAGAWASFAGVVGAARSRPVVVVAGQRDLDDEDLARLPPNVLCVPGQAVPEWIAHTLRQAIENAEARAETAFLRRVHRTIHGIQKAIRRETNAEKLLAEVCRIAVEGGDFRAAWVGRPDPARDVVVPVTVAGLDDDFLEQADVSFDVAPVGPMATAMRERRTVVIEDVAAEPDLAQWRSIAFERGLRSVAALPLYVDGVASAGFAVYDARPDVFLPEAVSLLEELADDIGFALAAIANQSRPAGAEAAVRESEELLRISVDTLPDGFAMLSAVRNEREEIADFRYRYVNRAGAELYGQAPEDVVGRGLRELPSSLHGALLDSYRRVVATGEPLMCESLAVEERSPEGGQPRAFDLQATRLGDGLIVAWRDVSDRRWAEEMLFRSNELLETIFSNLHLHIAYMDRDFNFIRVNNRYAEQDGREPGYFVGKNHFDLYPDADNDRLFRAVVETGVPYMARARPFVYPYDPDRGITFWDWMLKPVREVDGRISGVVLSLLDVTDNERNRRELERYRERLEELVGQRTADLEAATRELEAFSYSVSHDLRAPLRAIDAFSHMLIDDYRSSLDERGASYLNKVRQATERMSSLIDDLLLLSRVARRETRYVTVDVSALAEEVVAELREREPLRRVEVSIAPGLRARADEHLVRILLTNLLDNAWKFTARTQTPRIEVGCREADGVEVFFVRDNGAGFDMAYQDKLFNAFQRLHSESEFPGTGIGLAIVQRIAARHGGRVQGEAAPGRGATFSFTLRPPSGAAREMV